MKLILDFSIFLRAAIYDLDAPVTRQMAPELNAKGSLGGLENFEPD